MRGRFAPSPSGRMHLGNVASYLVAWLSARSQNGSIVLRIEDLDPRAQSPENARLIIDDFAWLGLRWDGDPVYQSERTEIYAEIIELLRDANLTYPCFCTRSELHAASAPHASDGTYIYPGTCRYLSAADIVHRWSEREPATRLRVPTLAFPDKVVVSFDDFAYGHVSENLVTECGDFLIQRSDGVVAYQLAVVVDDALMGVTEVVRGRDLLGSVARQMYLQDLLSYDHPAYGHVPLLVAPDGKRLSKRERSLDLGVLRERYESSEPILGALAYHLGLIEHAEPVDATSLIKCFSWEKIRSHNSDIVVDENFLP